jgi:hypothetical protein
MTRGDYDCGCNSSPFDDVNDHVLQPLRRLPYLWALQRGQPWSAQDDPAPGLNSTFRCSSYSRLASHRGACVLLIFRLRDERMRSSEEHYAVLRTPVCISTAPSSVGLPQFSTSQKLRLASHAHHYPHSPRACARASRFSRHGCTSSSPGLRVLSAGARPDLLRRHAAHNEQRDGPHAVPPQCDLCRRSAALAETGSRSFTDQNRYRHRVQQLAAVLCDIRCE